MAPHFVVITPYDPKDISKWSGTPYFIYDALRRKGVGLTFVRGPLGLMDLAARGLNKALRPIASLDLRFSGAYARLVGAWLTARLWFAKRGPLLVIAGSNIVPYLRTRRNIVYVSDTTFRAISKLYDSFNSFPQWLKTQGDRNEALSLAKARYVLLPSAWASQSAMQDYGIPKERIRELRFGPNIPETRMRPRVRSIRRDGTLIILFVAADWKRKNGDLALEVCQRLIEMGVKVCAILIGDVPESARAHSFVDYRGFLSKNVPEQFKELSEAYHAAHFLLMPTIAEASAIVFAEAQAFGLPPVSNAVGGTSSSIEDGKTGVLLPLGSDAPAFAARIMEYINAPERYSTLSAQCIRWHQERANWNTWADTIASLYEKGSR